MGMVSAMATEPNLAERGIDELRAMPRQKTALRGFALVGIVNIPLLAFNVVMIGISLLPSFAWGNEIVNLPYRLGGGHRLPWRIDTAYDCSGTVSWALHGAHLLSSPLPSGSFARWGVPGPGRWISVYYNAGHAWMTIAGLRLDTSMVPGDGPGWSTKMTEPVTQYGVRHAPNP